MVQFQISGFGNWQAMTLGKDGVSATMPTLQRGQSYDFEVLWITGSASSTGSVVAGVVAQWLVIWGVPVVLPPIEVVPTVP